MQKQSFSPENVLKYYIENALINLYFYTAMPLHIAFLYKEWLSLSEKEEESQTGSIWLGLNWIYSSGAVGFRQKNNNKKTLFVVLWLVSHLFVKCTTPDMNNLQYFRDEFLADNK